MADTVLRTQNPELVGAGYSDDDRTQGQHARYLNIYFATEVIGGLQAWRQAHRTGSRFQPQGGSDRLEFIPGARWVTMTFRRNSIRGNSILDIVARITGLPQGSDVDFRELTFTTYQHFLYQSLTGKSTFENSQYGFYACYITDYDQGYDDPEGEVTESGTMITQRYKYGSQGVTKYGMPTLSVSRAADSGARKSDLGAGTNTHSAVNSAAQSDAAAAAQAVAGIFGL